MTDTREAERDPDLALAESTRFQRQEWIAERVAWVVALVVLAAAVLGLFANGPLALGTASASDGRLTVDYQRYARDGVVFRIEAEAGAPFQATFPVHPVPANPG